MKTTHHASLAILVFLLLAVLTLAAQTHAVCNTPPVAIAGAAQLTGSLAVVDVLANDTLPDHETVEVQIVSGSCLGLAGFSVLGAVVSYRPHPGSQVPCAFTYRASAESGLPSTATVSITLPPAIFADGFESGNTLAWSASVP